MLSFILNILINSIALLQTQGPPFLLLLCTENTDQNCHTCCPIMLLEGFHIFYTHLTKNILSIQPRKHLEVIF